MFSLSHYSNIPLKMCLLLSCAYVYLQRKLDLVMKGQMDAEQEGVNIFEQEQWRSLALDAASWSLRPHEQLQVHMDCLNAVGEIVTIEDVDDMGGSVIMYCPFPCARHSTGWIAVFDLFLLLVLMLLRSAGPTFASPCTESRLSPTVRTRPLWLWEILSCSLLIAVPSPAILFRPSWLPLAPPTTIVSSCRATESASRTRCLIIAA